MRDQIEAISKQVEKIKEIAFTNRENLEFEQKDLTESEIDKIRESQKITDDITAYNIVNEYEKVKRLSKKVRWIYFGLMIIILSCLAIITADYIRVKITNEDVKNIEKQKETAQKQVRDLTEQLSESLEKGNNLSLLVKQKDEQIEILKKSLSESIKTPELADIHKNDSKEESSTQSGKLLASDAKDSPDKNQSSLSGNLSIKKEEPKSCSTVTTITINVRDTAGIDGKVLTFLNEGTQVDVISKATKNDRTWYEIKTQSITGWISSVGIEAFDAQCLK